MADELEPDDDGAPAAQDSSAAVALTLGSASREKADHFLEKQSRYLDLQMEDLHEQRDLTLSHLRWRRFNDQMRAARQTSLAILAILAVLVIGTAMWSAHEASGLVVRSLKTPPDFALKGLDGTVLAQRLLDKLNGLVAESEPIAFHSADSIRGDWGDVSKVEIPQTGVSIDELARALRTWLGHETHVSGEIWPTANGIAVTVRAESNPGATVTGPSADLDRLLDRAAEKILAQTQPYRYAGVLVQRGLYAQAVDFLRPIAHGANPPDRAWAYTFWSNTLVFAGQNSDAIPLANIAIRLNPSDPSAYFSRLSAEADLDQEETTLRNSKTLSRLMAESSSTRNLSMAAAAVMRIVTPCAICGLTGDYLCAANAARPYSEQNFYGFDRSDLLVASNFALAHDSAAARAILASHPQWNDATAVQFSPAVGNMMPTFFVLANVDRWAQATADAFVADRTIGVQPALADTRHTYLWPWLAYALARSGNIKDADALIARTPLDCTPCLEIRGRIAELKRNFTLATYWYDRAVRDAPSVPFALTDWGGMLLHKGDFDAAVAKFSLANRIGPHFADPLEMWGEALMLEKRSDFALAKFEEANKYAPNWGRLHMKWSESLGYVGRGDDAHAQYRIASTLDMSVADKAELAREMH